MNNNYICAILIMIASYAYSDEHGACVTITPYEDSDWSAVEKIINDFPENLKIETIGEPAGTTARLFKKDSECRNDVIRVNGKTVGFINYRIFNNYLAKIFLLRWGYVNLLGIDKDYHHKGYGTALIRHVKKEFEKHNVPIVRLTALDNAPIACALYKKEGFKVIKKTKEINGILRLYQCLLPIPLYKLSWGNIIHRHPKKSYAVIGALSFAIPYTLMNVLKSCKGMIHSGVSKI